MTRTTNSPAKVKAKYLTFQLSGETYGVEVSHIREIVAMLPVTLVPNAPKFIKGVINLRGKILPLMDLRIKFNMSCAEASHEACIVVMDLKLNSTQVVSGIIVDAVCEVVEVDPAAIESLPEFGTKIDTSFLMGVVRQGDAANLLLDIEKALSFEEKSNMQDVASNLSTSQV